SIYIHSHSRTPPHYISFFFFQYSPHHRDLHSFPTRRSSDLGIPENGNHHHRAYPEADQYAAAELPARLRQVAFYRNKLYARNAQDRKSTRLNSSHVSISYAVFCLKKKKKKENKKT